MRVPFSVLGAPWLEIWHVVRGMMPRRCVPWNGGECIVQLKGGKTRRWQCAKRRFAGHGALRQHVSLKLVFGAFGGKVGPTPLR